MIQWFANDGIEVEQGSGFHLNYKIKCYQSEIVNFAKTTLLQQGPFLGLEQFHQKI